MTAVAVCDFVFGTLNVLVAFFVIILAAMNLSKEFQTTHQQGFWMLILAAGLLNLPLAALLVAAGIGVLRGLSWGRTLSLAYAWIMLAFASPLVVAQLVKNFQMFRHASTIYSVMGLSNVVIFVVADIIRTVVIFCGSVGYPIILLFLFCRPAWKRAFAPRANT